MQRLIISEREARATAHLLRAVLHCDHPTVQMRVNLTFLDPRDRDATLRLCERLEAVTVGQAADREGRAA